MTNLSPSQAFISGGGRPPFFRYVARLYAGDVVFKSLVDFALIGGVVMLFLHPPSMDGMRSWLAAIHHSRGTPGVTPSTPSTPTPSAPVHPSQPLTPPASTTAPKSAPSLVPQAPTVTPPADVSAGVVMPLLDDMRHPRLDRHFLFEPDERVFRSSEADDRPKLLQAAQAFRQFRFSDMLANLAGARSSDPNVAFMRGLASLYSGNAALGTPELRAAAQGGQVQAALMLGIVLVTGPRGVDKDVAAGKKLIEDAAAKGDRAAQRAAGIGYLNGEFGVVDPFKAAEFLKGAVAAGDVAAIPLYAHMMFSGVGVAMDQAGAEDLLERAARDGLTLAQETLGNWAIERYKAGIINDPSEGVGWLEKAYQRGYSITALDRLAEFYSDDGRAEWRNRPKAFELYAIGAAFLDRQAQFGYATGLQFGYGGTKDLIKAYARYELARQIYSSSTLLARQKTLEAMISPAEKETALNEARLIRRDLKPIPRVIVLQYSDLPAPPTPWTAISAATPPNTPAPKIPSGPPSANP